jgi:THUMP domain-like/RNA cap guanine-N2 methyltransferase
VDLAGFGALRSVSGERALAEAGAQVAAGRPLAATITALRASYDPALVSAALTQVQLRGRARAKFGTDADRMFFTPEGLEQATRAIVAERHATRYAAAGVDRMLDLCCGIGGDLIAFARAGLRPHGVDADPLTIAVAEANAAALGVADRVSVESADVTTVQLAGWPAAFVDPSRREGGRRLFGPKAYSPPFSFVTELAAAIPHTGAKVAPGIPHDLVPAGAEAEWVSVDGEVKEAALWFGPLATADRRATVLPAGATLTGARVGEIQPPPVGPPGQWLYEPDGAVIRAGLVGAVVAALPGGRLIDPTIAYVAADAPAPTPLARGWEVTDVLPFSLKRLRALLRERGVGSVTVKKRGSAVDPEELRRQLRLSGPAHAVVVLTRVAGAPTVLVCARPPGG